MNPHESEETYHLPFGQRDRFALCTGIGYPSANGEFDLLSRFGRYDALADIDPIVAPGDVVKVQRSVTLVEMPNEIREYLVTMVRETRTHPGVSVGASPRAALSLQRCCQALALLEDSATVVPRHLQELFVVCLAHRIQTRAGHDPKAVCQEIVAKVRAPEWEEKPARADARRRPRDARGPQRRPAGRLPPRAPLRERLIRRRRARSPGAGAARVGDVHAGHQPVAQREDVHDVLLADAPAVAVAHHRCRTSTATRPSGSSRTTSGCASGSISAHWRVQ